MPEQERKNPRIEHIRAVVAQDDPTVQAAFDAVESFFRVLSKDGPHPPREEPPELDLPLFRRIYRELGDKNPLIALRAALVDEERQAERRELKGSKAVPEDTEPAATIHELLIPSTVIFTPTEQPSPPPVDQTPRPSAISGQSVRDLFPEIKPRKISELLKGLGVRHGNQGIMYDRTQAIAALTEYEDNKHQQSAEVKTPKKHIQKSRRRGYIPPPGYSQRKIFFARFPDIPPARVTRILQGLPYQGNREKYYSDVEAERALATYQEQQQALQAELEAEKRKQILAREQAKEEIQKERQKTSAEKSVERAQRRRENQFKIPAGYSDRRTLGEGFPELTRNKITALLSTLPTQQGLGRQRLYLEAEALSLLNAARDEQLQQVAKHQVERREAHQQHLQNDYQRKKEKRKARRESTQPDPTVWATTRTLAKEYTLRDKVVHNQLRGTERTRWNRAIYYNRVVAATTLSNYIANRENR